MKLLRKILPIVFLLILLAAAALSGAVLWKWHTVIKSGEKMEFVRFADIEKINKGILLGQRFQAGFLLMVPWGTRPESIQTEPGKGVQLTKEPTFKRIKCLWGKTLYEASIEMQAYQTGKLECGNALVLFSGKKVLTDLKLPAVEIKERQTDHDTPKYADLPEQKSLLLPWILFAVVLFLLIVMIFLFFRKKKQETARIIPFWEQAVNAIGELVGRVRKGVIAPEDSLAQLTDIVRKYLEQRFHLRAEHQTTPEFLQDMEHGKSAEVLPEDQKGFLRDFLNAAELVKFAGLPADTTLFEDAAEKAGRLIRETIPAMEEKEKKQ